MSGKKHRKPRDRTPADLLASLADALNACEQGEVPVRPKHGALFSRYGVILPPHGKTGWAAKVFGMLPQAPEEDRP